MRKSLEERILAGYDIKNKERDYLDGRYTSLTRRISPIIYVLFAMSLYLSSIFKIP